MNIPIFPLSVFMLPEGVTRLRIFEQRYLKMVKLAVKTNGFAIMLNSQKEKQSPIASWVEITNFDLGNDGILIIDVRCKTLVILSELTIDKDDLIWSDISPVSHWPKVEHCEITQNFSLLLKSYFEQSEELNSLYSGEFNDQAGWVMARWLELLPINTQDKERFFSEFSFQQAQHFLSDVLSSQTTD